MAKRTPKAPKATAANFTDGVDDTEAVNPGPPPGVVMSDDPAVPAQFLRPQPPSESPPKTHEDGPVPPPSLPRSLAGMTGARPAGIDPSIVQPESRPDGSPLVQYEHRIRVLEAFQYPGSYTGAPAWISRDWLVYGDYDERRKIPAGPALQVPSPRHPTGTALCRKGDYIVKQEIILATGLDPEERVEVWERDEFERLFIPAPPKVDLTERPFGVTQEEWLALTPEERATVRANAIAKLGALA